MSVHFRDLKGHKDLSVSLDRKGQTYVTSMNLDFFQALIKLNSPLTLVFDIFLRTVDLRALQEKTDFLDTQDRGEKRWAGSL